MDKQILTQWIHQVLEMQDYDDFQVSFSGNSGKTDGYLGEIIFVNAKCRDRTRREKKVVDFVVKSGAMKNREELPFIRSVFLQEIAIYDEFLPLFHHFQMEKKVTNPFDNVPRCYKTVDDENFEALILENLKSDGYDIHDRKVPLNVEHVKKLLEAYAKFHAISIAVNDQRPEEITKRASKLMPFVKERFRDSEGFPKTVNVFFQHILTLLKERNKMQLHAQIVEFLKKDPNEELLKLLTIPSKFKIVSHADAWINNYMFKYADSDKKSTPSNVKIIDWQMADILNSPVYDLSHFLYNCASVEDLNNLDSFLVYYHDCLSGHLTSLGSDPEKLFPFTLLKEHWKIFRLFGFVHVPYVIKQSYWNEEDVPDVIGMDNWSEWSGNIVIQDERYYDRLIGILDHYFNYKL